MVSPISIVRRAGIAAAIRLANALPQTIVAKIVPRPQRFSARARPELGPVPTTERRLYVAPVNSAGQGNAWARAIERNSDDVGATVMEIANPNGFGYAADYRVPLGTYRWSKSWQRAQRSLVADRFTHVMVESGRRLFGDGYPGSTADEIELLRARGLAVALVFHGSDIRAPARHASSSKWSPYRDGVWNLTPELSRVAAMNARLVATVDCPTFVSTPDLLLDVPEATWLPVVVDPGSWSTASLPFGAGALPRVAHAPSRGAVKGSDLVDPVLERLHAEGLLEYVRVSGIAASGMPAVYAGVDIVLDQFRLGSYGVAACEAMAAGRIVVSHVSSQVRDHVASATGQTLPIVEATADVLERVLREIVADPAEYVAGAQRGISFSHDVHDGRRSAEAMRAFISMTSS